MSHLVTTHRAGLPTLLSLAIALAVAAPLPVLAADSVAEARSYRFDIPAQSLDSALAAFSAVTRTQVLVPAELTQGRRSPGIAGSYGSSEALARLLSNTGLVARFVDQDTVTLEVPAEDSAALELRATTISGQTSESAYGPVQGYVAKRSATGTKTDTAILETPQTINVVTQDEIKARGALSLNEALRYTPGIQVDGFSTRIKSFDEATSRGFSPSPQYLDGLHLPYGGGSTGGALQIDPYLLERVEVLKGPASVLYGQNQPGGIVNMVTKRPTAEPLRQVVLGTGSYDRRYGAFDVAGAIDEQGTFLYRLTGVVNDSNGEIDYTNQKRMLIAPSLTWNISEQTTLTFFAQYQKDNDSPNAQALPAIGTVLPNPNGKVPRHRFNGEPDFNSYDRDQYAFGYELSHELNDVWTLKQNARYGYVNDHFIGAFNGWSFSTNPATGLNDQSFQDRYGVDWKQKNKVYGIDNIAQAVFGTGEVNHTLLLGLDYYHFNSQFFGRYDTTPPGIDLYNPVYGRPLDFNKTGPGAWDNTVTQTGLYIQDQLKWNKWFLTLGGRFDIAETNNRTPLSSGQPPTKKDREFSGRAGFGYLFDNGITPYVSYSESFLPVPGTDRNMKSFEASTGEQYEVGIKYQPPGSESFIQLSAYQIDMKNVLTSDPTDWRYSEQTAALRSVGFELEGKANLSENLNIIASVSRVDAEYTKSNDYKGRHPRGLSPMTASAWIDYQMPDGTAFTGLGFGVGARYVRSSPGTAGAYNEFSVPSFTVYDGMIAYDLAKSPLQIKGVKVQANVENLDNKQYVSRCVGFWECYYGQGRTATANVTFDW
ncbi:TonB-dependent siderophore receptor [Aquipseudomonas campi]